MNEQRGEDDIAFINYSQSIFCRYCIIFQKHFITLSLKEESISLASTRCKPQQSF